MGDRSGSGLTWCLLGRNRWPRRTLCSPPLWESTHTRLQGAEAPCLPQTTVIPKLLHYGSQAAPDKLPSRSHVLPKSCHLLSQAAMLSGSPFPVAYFYHDLLYSPCFPLCKGQKIYIFLLQLQLLRFSTTGFNQLKLRSNRDL